MKACIIVGAGGCIGAVCRYLAGLIPLKETGPFPLRTFLINVAGSLLIGMIAAWAERLQPPSPEIVLFLKTGVCGGFTTFSTFALETGSLMEEGKTLPAVLYAVCSMAAGVLAVFAGRELVRRI